MAGFRLFMLAPWTCWSPITSAFTLSHSYL